MKAPYKNCGWKNKLDGCCSHPENRTPECHEYACPIKPNNKEWFRWAYKLLVCLAMRKLAEANASREEPGDWPVGQSWEQLSDSSRGLFLRQARQEAGVPDEPFLEVIRSNKVDVSDIYERSKMMHEVEKIKEAGVEFFDPM